MQIHYSKQIVNYFSSEELQVFLTEVQHKLPAFIANDYFRIKPIRALKSKQQVIYEVKIHANQKNYRVAFIATNDELFLYYVSTKIVKEQFEKQFIKWYKKQGKLEFEA